MGFLDFLLTNRQKKEKIATRIGLDSGLFVMCPVCHGVTESRKADGIDTQTKALVQQLVSENHPDMQIFHRDEAEILETITKVATDLPYHCTCESI